jgi:hypothetical protein
MNKNAKRAAKRSYRGIPVSTVISSLNYYYYDNVFVLHYFKSSLRPDLHISWNPETAILLIRHDANIKPEKLILKPSHWVRLIRAIPYQYLTESLNTLQIPYAYPGTQKKVG